MSLCFQLRCTSSAAWKTRSPTRPRKSTSTARATKIITISGSRTAIVDYERQELLEIDRAAVDLQRRQRSTRSQSSGRRSILRARRKIADRVDRLENNAARRTEVRFRPMQRRFLRDHHGQDQGPGRGRPAGHSLTRRARRDLRRGISEQIIGSAGCGRTRMRAEYRCPQRQDDRRRDLRAAARAVDHVRGRRGDASDDPQHHRPRHERVAAARNARDSGRRHARRIARSTDAEGSERTGRRSTRFKTVDHETPRRSRHHPGAVSLRGGRPRRRHHERKSADSGRLARSRHAGRHDRDRHSHHHPDEVRRQDE